MQRKFLEKRINFSGDLYKNVKLNKSCQYWNKSLGELKQKKSHHEDILLTKNENIELGLKKHSEIEKKQKWNKNNSEKKTIFVELIETDNQLI